MSRNGLHIITPTSVSGTTTNAAISANGSVTFDYATPININGVFTSAYDDYMVVLNILDVDLSYNLNSRLNLAGTQNTSTYNNQSVQFNGTTITGVRTIGTAWLAGGLQLNNTSIPSGIIMYVYGPALASQTAMRSITVFPGTSTTTVTMVDSAAVHTVTSAFDGISFYGSGFKGRITVYGMRQ